MLVAELHAAFLDDEEGCPAHRANGHAAEGEQHRAAQDHADEHILISQGEQGRTGVRLDLAKEAGTPCVKIP